MLKKIIVLSSVVSLFFFNINYLSAEIATIIPLKKPILTGKEIEKKVSINILKPLKKPKNKINEKKIKVKVEEKFNFLIPKKKPVIAGINKTKSIKISKYYSKKDFSLAKKAVSEMEKGKWSSSLKTAKKAKDKSIYNFIQWRHLLTSGNSASFYDYKLFIDNNPNYARIGRIKYLAEHKLSTKKISPKKIIDWFNNEEPLSGFGKMILGESHILRGELSKGNNLIKQGWITADLSKNELIFYRKKNFYKYFKTTEEAKRQKK